MHTKVPFYDKYWKKNIILGYNNRESFAMVAILNKKNFLRWDFRGPFTRVLKIEAFYIFPG